MRDMPEVKWIKLTTDMFENRKIRHLRKLPDGNNIVLIWVMLLTLAGKCNAGGMIFLTENVPYTPKMLADELDFEENTVLLALDALETLGMIQRDGFLKISGWEDHQNADGLDKIREQTRKRVANYRERQKALQPSVESDDCNATSNDTVTQCNAPRIRKERELEVRTEKEKEVEVEIEKESEKKGGVGGRKKEKAFVPPSLEEVTAYCNGRNSPVDPKQFYEYFTVGGWIDSEGKPVKNWKQKLLTWEKMGSGRSVGKNGIQGEKPFKYDYGNDADTLPF